jgi:radical SAM/Cys-rich protein
MIKSLKARQHQLADIQEQIDVLEQTNLVPFQQKLAETNLWPLTTAAATTMQINVGKMCNQVCAHCHVDAGPDRKEIMTKETMEQCLSVLAKNPHFTTVDLTGGAPELNPNFRWLVAEIKKMDKHIIVRCNLTIILANKKFYDLPDFFKANGVEVVSSLPFYTKDRTDKQRGDGVFDDSIKALQMLNKVGYGLENTGLVLNLVYNPAGAFLPASQQLLEADFKSALFKDFGIQFNNLFAITNLPISRYLDWLLQTNNYEKYMQKLIAAYNPAAAANVMCRSTLSISWDGFLYDCDFNQMLNLKIDAPTKHIKNLEYQLIKDRNIIIGQHCFGCTAGAGSSCGGTVA